MRRRGKTMTPTEVDWSQLYSFSQLVRPGKHFRAPWSLVGARAVLLGPVGLRREKPQENQCLLPPRLFASDGFLRPQDGPKMAQEGPKRGPRGP